MVSDARLALNPVDRLLGCYVAFVTLVIVFRGDILAGPNLSMLTMHALFGLLLFLFTRLTPAATWGRLMHDLYPLVMLFPFYAEFALLNPPAGAASVLGHDAIIQEFEQAVFGGQISYTWIRNAPSVFWSGTLHLAYFMYYAIVSFPIFVWLRGRPQHARAIIFPMMVAFVICYMFFVLWPVAGPYYAFDQPAGPVREVWSARLVYNVLSGGSSFGAAFPSSHVAATLATTLSVLRHERRYGVWFIVPCLLLIVGTVYCQMHYGIDATAGIVVGLVAFFVGTRVFGPRLVTSDS